MQNRGRINTAAEPYAQGDIRNQMLTNSILHQGIKLFFRGSERVSVRNSKWQLPVGTRRHFTVLPFQPVSRSEFFDALHHRPRRRDVIQREITIESFEAQLPVHL